MRILLLFLFLPACVSISAYRKDMQMMNDAMKVQNDINKTFEEIFKRDVEIMNTLKTSLNSLEIYCASNEKRIKELEDKLSQSKRRIK